LFTDQAVDGWTGPPTAAFANALVAAAQLAFRQGDQHGAVERCERAIAAAEASATPAAAAMAHVNLARVAFRDGRADDIERHARIALDLGGSDAGAQRGGLHMLGWAAHTAGDLDLAMRRFEESLAFRRSLGDRFGVTVELANLADLAAERGDHPAAARQLRDALATARELESAYLVLNLLPSIAAIAAASGDWDSAARLMGATDAMTASSGLEPDPGAWQQAIDDAAASYGTAFARARSAGRRLEAEEAADLGMRVASTIGREPATG
jgi:tetratricopeptide (TPR) repeat protein